MVQLFNLPDFVIYTLNRDLIGNVNTLRIFLGSFKRNIYNYSNKILSM